MSNFRNFADLELQDCSAINLITGMNGSGKTAVLEAVYLNCEAGNVNSILTVNNNRGENLSQYVNDRLFRSIFHNFLTLEHASINGQWKNVSTDATPSNRDLTLKPILPTWKYTPLPETNEIISGIEFDFKGSGQKSQARAQWVEMLVSDQNIANPINTTRNSSQPARAVYQPQFDPPNPRVSLRSVYLVPSPRTSTNFIYQHLVNATKEKNLPKVIEIATIIDRRVVDFSPIFENGTNQIYVDIGAARLFPLTMMGAGFSNILQIAIGIVQTKSQVVIIDEIEDGLHYTTFPNLAKVLMSLARSMNLQFFISTHSGEFLDAFVDAANNEDFVDVCAFRIADGSGGKIVTRFAYWELAEAKKIDLDIR